MLARGSPGGVVWHLDSVEPSGNNSPVVVTKDQPISSTRNAHATMSCSIRRARRHAQAVCYRRVHIIRPRATAAIYWIVSAERCYRHNEKFGSHRETTQHCASPLATGQPSSSAVSVVIETMVVDGGGVMCYINDTLSYCKLTDLQCIVVLNRYGCCVNMLECLDVFRTGAIQ